MVYISNSPARFKIDFTTILRSPAAIVLECIQPIAHVDHCHYNMGPIGADHNHCKWYQSRSGLWPMWTMVCYIISLYGVDYELSIVFVVRFEPLVS